VSMQLQWWLPNQRDCCALRVTPMECLTFLPYWISLTHADWLAGLEPPVSVQVVPRHHVSG
jgi:hypothetical protein